MCFILNIDSFIVDYHKINVKKIRIESQIQFEAKEITDIDGG